MRTLTSDSSVLCTGHLPVICERLSGSSPRVSSLYGVGRDVDATLALMDRLVTRGAKVHGHTFLPLPGTPFRRAAPGALTPAVRLRLRQLASKGQLYGQWEQQEATARDLAAARVPR